VSDKVEDIVLIGGGGHSLSCIPILERVERVRIKGIVDVIEKVGDEVLGYKIVGTDEHLEQFDSYKYIAMSFNQIFRAEILNIAPGVINCHAGALPFYRRNR
jgi:methionyl-tRNA formyltransferase